MSFHWRPDLWNSHQRCKLPDHQDLYSNHHREDYDHHMVFNDIVLISNIRCAQMWQKPSAARFQKPSKSTPLKTSWCHFISSCKDRLMIVTMMNKTLIVLTRVNYQRISGRRKVAQRWTSRSAHRTTRTCAGITKLRSDRFQEELHWNMWLWSILRIDKLQGWRVRDGLRRGVQEGSVPPVQDRQGTTFLFSITLVDSIEMVMTATIMTTTMSTQSCRRRFVTPHMSTSPSTAPPKRSANTLIGIIWHHQQKKIIVLTFLIINVHWLQQLS